MESTTQFKVIIIGSGLAGNCLANGLLRSNIDFQVFERLPQDTKREGYQIRLGASALKGMRACLSAEHLHSIAQKFGRASGLKAQAPSIFSRQFEKLIDLTKFSSYNKSAPISRVVLRDALAEPISRAGKLQYGKQFHRYEILNPNTNQERVRVWFEDGSYDDCDIIIAADGSHSKINTQVGLDNIRGLQGYTSMVSKNELPTKTFTELPRTVMENPVMAFTNRKSLYFCAYLPEKLDEIGKYDESLSSSFLGINIPDDEIPKDFAQQSKEDQWNSISSILKDWASEYHTIINLVKDNKPHVYKGRYSVEPPKNWRSKITLQSSPERGNARVWLIGDAMHAMLPNRGMGGNTALHDTATVLPLLERLSDLAAKQQNQLKSTQIQEALGEYEAEMIPRAFAWVKKSGGANIAPIDTDTISGIAFIRVVAVVLTIVGWWYSFIGLFRTDKPIDDAPELK